MIDVMTSEIEIVKLGNLLVCVVCVCVCDGLRVTRSCVCNFSKLRSYEYICSAGLHVAEVGFTVIRTSADVRL